MKRPTRNTSPPFILPSFPLISIFHILLRLCALPFVTPGSISPSRRAFLLPYSSFLPHIRSSTYFNLSDLFSDSLPPSPPPSSFFRPSVFPLPIHPSSSYTSSISSVLACPNILGPYHIFSPLSSSAELSALYFTRPFLELSHFVHLSTPGRLSFLLSDLPYHVHPPPLCQLFSPPPIPPVLPTYRGTRR